MYKKVLRCDLKDFNNPASLRSSAFNLEPGHEQSEGACLRSVGVLDWAIRCVISERQDISRCSWPSLIAMILNVVFAHTMT